MLPIAVDIFNDKLTVDNGETSSSTATVCNCNKIQQTMMFASNELIRIDSRCC